MTVFDVLVWFADAVDLTADIMSDRFSIGGVLVDSVLTTDRSIPIGRDPKNFMMAAFTEFSRRFAQNFLTSLTAACFLKSGRSWGIRSASHWLMFRLVQEHAFDRLYTTRLCYAGMRLFRSFSQALAHKGLTLAAALVGLGRQQQPIAASSPVTQQVDERREAWDWWAQTVNDHSAFDVAADSCLVDTVGQFLLQQVFWAQSYLNVFRRKRKVRADGSNRNRKALVQQLVATVHAHSCSTVALFLEGSLSFVVRWLALAASRFVGSWIAGRGVVGTLAFYAPPVLSFLARPAVLRICCTVMPYVDQIFAMVAVKVVQITGNSSGSEDSTTDEDDDAATADSGEGGAAEPGRGGDGADEARFDGQMNRDLSASTDHYAVLGVAETATEPEIKAAYRKLALACHPDKADPDLSPVEREARTARFKAVSAANTVLSNPQTRRQYDMNRAFGANGDVESGSVSSLPAGLARVVLAVATPIARLPFPLRIASMGLITGAAAGLFLGTAFAHSQVFFNHMTVVGVWVNSPFLMHR